MECSNGQRQWGRSLSLHLAAAILALVGGALPSSGQPAPAITIAWDANREPDVDGYLVYVGTASGVYASTHDVGHRTSFTYAAPLQGRRYYFAVAAYAAGQLIGQRSAEISAVAGVALFQSGSAASVLPSPDPSPSTPPAALAPRSRESSSAAAPEASVICDASGSTTCFARRRLSADSLGSITALAATPDGQVFAIENGARLRVINGGAGMPGTYIALRTGDPAVRLTGVAIDPNFLHTRYVFVGLTRTAGDGRRELSIVRYRDLQNSLGEPTVVVAGLPLSGPADAPFAVDAASRVYVAMPAEGQRRRDPYAGYVLWFNTDGSVPSGSRGGSPILAHGYPAPLALALAGDRLWLVGSQVSWSSAIAQVPPLIDAKAQWPLVPLVAPISIPEGAGAEPALRAFQPWPTDGAAIGDRAAIVDTIGRLHRLRVFASERSERMETFVWPDGQRAAAVAGGGGQRLHVILQMADGTFALEELSAYGGAASHER